MKKNAGVKEAAGNLLNWINELHVEENGMRTDAAVCAEIELHLAYP